MATVSSVIAQSRSQRLYSNLRFPDSGHAHCIVMTFSGYDYEAAGAGLVKPSTNINGSVVLPLPTNIQDSYSVRVGGDDLGVIGGAAVDAMTRSGGDVLRDLQNQVSSVQGQLQNFDALSMFSNIGNASRYFARSAIASLPGGDDISRAIGVVSGTAINPHTTLTFNGVDLKNHQFTWNLSPKNERESVTLNNIIRKIKGSMLPQYKSVTGRGAEGTTNTLSRGLLSYPDLVNIYFLGIDPAYYFYFKPAMIKSFNVDFTPNGMAINRGGRPSTVTLTMQLEESKIWTREDAISSFNIESQTPPERRRGR